MKEIQRRMQEMLCSKTIYHRWLACLTALSVLIVIIVPLNLMKPGAAATNYTFPEGQEYFSEVPAEENVNAWGTNLANGHLVGIAVNGQTSPPYNLNGGSNSTLSLQLALDYAFDDATAVINDPFVAYQLPENVNLTQSSYGIHAVVSDPNYSGPAGYYFISKKGLIVIHFTNDYITYVRDHSHGLHGSVDFSCYVERNDERDGSQDVTLGAFSFTVPFDPTNLSQNKSYTTGIENGTRYIDWKIEITNPNSYINMQDFVLTDTMNNAPYNLSNATVKYYKNYQEIYPSNGYTINNGSIVFNKLEPNPDKIEIVYRQTDPPQNTDITNKSSLTKANENVPDSQLVTVRIENAYALSKSGTPDYDVTGSTNHEIYWTMDVGNNLNESLAKTKITDTYPLTGCTVYYLENGEYKEAAASDYTLSSDGTELTFADGVTYSHAQIQYKTSNISLTGDNDGDDKRTTVYNSASAESLSDNPNKPPKKHLTILLPSHIGTACI